MKDSIMKMKHTRREMRDEDFQKVIDAAIADYKERYEWTLSSLIRGKSFADEFIGICGGAQQDAAMFFVENVDD